MLIHFTDTNIDISISKSFQITYSTSPSEQHFPLSSSIDIPISDLSLKALGFPVIADAVCKRYFPVTIGDTSISDTPSILFINSVNRTTFKCNLLSPQFQWYWLLKSISWYDIPELKSIDWTWGVGSTIPNYNENTQIDIRWHDSIMAEPSEIKPNYVSINDMIPSLSIPYLLTKLQTRIQEIFSSQGMSTSLVNFTNMISATANYRVLLEAQNTRSESVALKRDSALEPYDSSTANQVFQGPQFYVHRFVPSANSMFAQALSYPTHRTYNGSLYYIFWAILPACSEQGWQIENIPAVLIFPSDVPKKVPNIGLEVSGQYTVNSVVELDLFKTSYASTFTFIAKQTEDGAVSTSGWSNYYGGFPGIRTMTQEGEPYFDHVITSSVIKTNIDLGAALYRDTKFSIAELMTGFFTPFELVQAVINDFSLYLNKSGVPSYNFSESSDVLNWPNVSKGSTNLAWSRAWYVDSSTNLTYWNNPSSYRNPNYNGWISTTSLTNGQLYSVHIKALSSKAGAKMALCESSSKLNEDHLMNVISPIMEFTNAGTYYTWDFQWTANLTTYPYLCFPTATSTQAASDRLKTQNTYMLINEFTIKPTDVSNVDLTDLEWELSYPVSNTVIKVDQNSIEQGDDHPKNYNILASTPADALIQTSSKDFDFKFHSFTCDSSDEYNRPLNSSSKGEQISFSKSLAYVDPNSQPYFKSWSWKPPIVHESESGSEWDDISHPMHKISCPITDFLITSDAHVISRHLVNHFSRFLSCNTNSVYTQSGSTPVSSPIYPKQITFLSPSLPATYHLNLTGGPCSNTEAYVESIVESPNAPYKITVITKPFVASSEIHPYGTVVTQKKVGKSRYNEFTFNSGAEFVSANAVGQCSVTTLTASGTLSSGKVTFTSPYGADLEDGSYKFLFTYKVDNVVFTESILSYIGDPSDYDNYSVMYRVSKDTWTVDDHSTGTLTVRLGVLNDLQNYRYIVEDVTGTVTFKSTISINSCTPTTGTFNQKTLTPTGLGTANTSVAWSAVYSPAYQDSKPTYEISFQHLGDTISYTICGETFSESQIPLTVDIWYDSTTESIEHSVDPPQGYSGTITSPNGTTYTLPCSPILNPVSGTWRISATNGYTTTPVTDSCVVPQRTQTNLAVTCNNYPCTFIDTTTGSTIGSTSTTATYLVPTGHRVHFHMTQTPSLPTGSHFVYTINGVSTHWDLPNTAPYADFTLDQGNNTFSLAVSSQPATTYTINIETDPASGWSVSPSSGTTYNSGDLVYLTATPPTGYSFMYWYNVTDSQVLSYNSTHSFNITKNLTLRASASASPVVGTVSITFSTVSSDLTYAVVYTNASGSRNGTQVTRSGSVTLDVKIGTVVQLLSDNDSTVYSVTVDGETSTYSSRSVSFTSGNGTGTNSVIAHL